MKALISTSYTSEDTEQAATSFAKKFNYPCGNNTKVNTSLILNYTDEYVELRDNDKNISIHIDFLSGNLAHRQQYGGGRGQSIAKAIGLKQGVKPPYVIDATAGLAKDAYVMACLGCPVTLIERSPIIVELIRDAIERAREDEHFQNILKTGFNVISESSIDYLTQLKDLPDVIYLDPMYPDKKKSAAVKKNMQILQKLLGKDEDTKVLLEVALKMAKKRVVVKRPKGSENLTDIKPTYLVESKKTRYDVYIIQEK
jgi:16S rRNA (guanine1516-N2)-methyltransferase